MTPTPPTRRPAAFLSLFNSTPPAERELTEPLRGLVAEMALTGIIRCDWQLVRPLLEFLLEMQLQRFEENSSVEVRILLVGLIVWLAELSSK